MHRLTIDRGSRRLPIYAGWLVSGRFVSQLLALGCVLATLWLFLPPTAIRRLDVHGTEHLAESVVAREAALLGESPFRVDPKAVAKRLIESLPLSSAEVIVRVDGTADIRIVEEAPALVWRANGRTYLVSPRGKVISVASDPRPLPVVDSSTFDPAAGGDLPREIVSQIVDLSSRFHQVTGAKIASIGYDADLGISVLSDAGWQVRFGTGDLDAKLRILSALLAKGYRWTLLDLRFGSRPFMK